MKDRLRNVFPRNPTQTRYLRFLKGPKVDMKLENLLKDFDKGLRDRLDTHYLKHIRDLDRKI